MTPATVTSRAVVVWVVAVLAYASAIFARTSLSATGVDAALRFGASSSVLSLFTVLQLAVYAAMQVPAGAVLDRIGARKAIALGCVLIGVGQLALGFADTAPEAVGARVLVGTGDAFVFISVVRLIPAWFPRRTVPFVTQIAGITGQLGQLLSLGPLVGLVHAQGWTTAFVAAGALLVVLAALVLLVVRDGDRADVHVLTGTTAAASPGAEAAGASAVEQHEVPVRESALRATWRSPGTRVGFWVHFVSPFTAYSFALLWGHAYLTEGLGLAEPTALGVLSAYVIACLAMGPVVGILSSRHPRHRIRIVLAVVALHVGSWVVVLAWPGRVPVAVAVGLALALSAGGPSSLLGFDFARDTNRPSNLGLATGMVNAGGFVASLTSVLLVGLVLDVLGQTSPDLYTRGGFALAWAAQVPLWVLGLAMIRRHWSAYRAADPVH